jgi:hypothetical protein
MFIHNLGYELLGFPKLRFEFFLFLLRVLPFLVASSADCAEFLALVRAGFPAWNQYHGLGARIIKLFSWNILSDLEPSRIDHGGYNDQMIIIFLDSPCIP